MIKIELQNANNGIIKKITDTQFNGADQFAEITTLYEIEEDDDLYIKYSKIIKFLRDITKDLAIDIGSEHSSVRLTFNLDWGLKYNPTKEEVIERIKDLNSEIREWKEYKKIIESDLHVHNI